MLDEIARQDLTARQAYTDGARALIDAITRLLGADDPVDARERSIGLYTLLVSSLQLARAVTDPDLSDQILASAYRNAMRIADSSAPPSSQTQGARALRGDVR